VIQPTLLEHRSEIQMMFFDLFTHIFHFTFVSSVQYVLVI
jgi:hypothetical protein